MDSTNLIASIAIQLLTIIVYILRKKFKISASCVEDGEASATVSRNTVVPQSKSDDVPRRLDFSSPNYASSHGTI